MPPAEALEDIAHNSGVLAPHDGPDAPWRYLHRSLRERLAASALAAAGPDALLTRVRTLTAAGGKLDADRLAQWGETLGMACALLAEPETAISEIRKHSPLLALRVLPEVETLSAEAALAVIETIKPAKGHLLGR
ncbi:MAG: hypothetical protein H6701_04825 [Myxococcales bacterium]|nr:hypothetical protein [Myxococcales bacterium]